MAQLCEILSLKSSQLTQALGDLKHKGQITHNPDGVYRLPEPKPASTPEPGQTEAKPLPTEYDKFREIGVSLGIIDPFLKEIANYIFSLNFEDVNAVHQNLLKLNLRPDVVARWVAMWSAFLGQPVPKMAPDTKQSQDGDGWDAVAGQVLQGGPHDFNRARQLARDQLLAQSTPKSVDDPEKEALKRELAELKEKQLRTEILQGVRDQLEPLKLLVAQTSQKALGASEYDIMLKAVDKIDKLTTVVDRIQGHIEGVIKDNPDLIRPFFRPPRPGMPPEQQANIIKGIEQSLIVNEELDELAQRAFYGKGSEGFGVTELPTHIKVVRCGSCGQSRQIDLLQVGMEQGNLARCPHCQAMMDLRPALAGQSTSPPAESQTFEPAQQEPQAPPEPRYKRLGRQAGRGMVEIER